MKEIISKVLENVDLDILKNYRDIDLKDGDLIVTGWNFSNSAYIIMGVYKGGDIHTNVELENTIVLKDVEKGEESKIKFLKEDYAMMETAEWWRTPTDNEVKLYYQTYKEYDVIKHIDELISHIEDDIVDNEDIIDTLSYIKDFIKRRDK